MSMKPSRKSACYGDNPVLHAAWLYYQDELNQSEVADILGVSRASVIKYLQQAREEGYVHITLNQQRYTTVQLALELKQRFQLRDVLLTPDDGGLHPLKQRLQIAGAGYLRETVTDNDVLGVAWGSTIFQMIQRIQPKALNNVTVVQMIGSMNSPSGFTAEECSASLAHKFGGQCVNLHVPAVVSSARLATELLAEPIIRKQFSMLEQCNKAVFGIGTCTQDNQMVHSGILSPEEMESYRTLGAVGILCGRFYDRHGRLVITDLDQRILGITLAELRQIPERILIGGGTTLLAPMRAALRGGYVTDLVTDEASALALLADETSA